jgi:hypothetical protein
VFEKFLGKTVEEAVPNILVHLVNGTLSVGAPVQAASGRSSRSFKKFAVVAGLGLGAAASLLPGLPVA